MIPNNPKTNSWKQNNPSHDIGWNESKLFYLFINDVDVEFKESYYMNNWELMSKTFIMKYMKVRPYLKVRKVLTDEEEKQFRDRNTIKQLLSQLRKGQNDCITEFNNGIVLQLVDNLIEKMFILDEKMAKSGLYLLLNKKREDRPAAFAGDDY